MMKKFLLLSLALIMVLGMVQLPASADETVILKATMQGRANPAASLFHSIYSNGGGSYYVDDGYAGKGSFARTITSTSYAEVVREGSDTAIEFVTNSAGDAVYTYVENFSHTVQADDVLKFGFDFKTADNNCDKTFTFRHVAGSYQWHILKFLQNGTVTFNGVYVCDYDVDTWYAYDLYYNNATKLWYIVVNNEFVKTIKFNADASVVSIIRFDWKAPAGVTTTVTLDNLEFSVLTTSELAGVLPYYYNGFDTLTANKVFNTSNGATTAYSGGPNFSNEAFGAGSGAIAANSGNATITIVERSAGNNAVKIHANGSKAESQYLHAADMALPFGSGDVLKIAFDYKIDQPNIKGQIFPRTNVGDTWDFIEFESNGVLYFYNNPVMVYTPGTWYDVEAYYNCEAKIWYLYVNDEFVYSINRDFYGNTLKLTRFTWNASLGSETDVYLDNYIADAHATRYDAYVNPTAPTQTTFTAVKNVADGGKNVFVDIKSPDAISGNVVIALYNGNELSEVIVKKAVAKTYVTFTKEGTEAKAMWLNTDSTDITPKHKAVPISFAN